MQLANSGTPSFIDATSYREFLKLALKDSTHGKSQLTVAELSRRAGFSSRSYPADVMNGHRRVTLSSLPGFIRGLNLKGDQRILFCLLVSKEEPDVNVDGLTPKQIDKRLMKVRYRLHNRFSNPTSSKPKALYQLQSCLEVYAALGTLKDGACLQEIRTRTRLSARDCEEALAHLEKFQVIRVDVALERYYPLENEHLIFETIKSNTPFQQHYLSMLSYFIKRASVDFDGNDRLFFSSTFSIRKERAPEFKRELRELVLRFIDNSEDPLGDSIAKMIVGFVPGS
jgi:uncharacterized protein (TIGR02147 family)